MKRNFKLIAAVLVLAVMALTLASCEYIEGAVGDIKDSVGNVIDKIVPHEHEFSADWSSDATNHWHAAICDKKDECASATADLAAHTFADGVCSVCGYTEEAPHEHNYVNGKCECGAEDPDYVPTCTEHAYSINVTKEATCTEEGEKTFTCTVCGHSETQTVAPLGHDEKTIEGKAPTCTETGLSSGKQCSVCGEITKAQAEIAATGHSFVDGACSVCGEVDPDYNGPKTYLFETNTVVIYNEDGTQNLTDKAELPTDVTYCNGYFSIIGSVVQRIKNSEYVYCVEVNKQLKGGIQFTVTGTAAVEINFHSTGGSNTSWIGLIDAEGNLIANNEGVNTVTGTGEGLTVTYNLTAGTYTVVSPALTDENGEDPYNRAARVYYVKVTETPAEEEPAPSNEIKVTTTDTYGYNDLYSFTANESGTYTFSIPAGLGFYSKAQYDVYGSAEADFMDNANGTTVSVSLAAGTVYEFYVGAMTRGDWLITYEFVAGEVNPDDPGTDTPGDDNPVLSVGPNTVVVDDAHANDGVDYTFTAEVDGTYTFGGDLLAIVLDEAGTQLGRGQVSLTAGTYTVKLVSLMGAGTYNVNVSVETAGEAGEPDGSEQNPYIWETLPESVTLDYAVVSGKVYYIFTATADGSVTFTWPVEGDSWYDYFELDANGNLTNNNGSGFMATSHSFVVEAGKSYRVSLGSWAESGSHTITIAFVACAHEWSEATCQTLSTCSKCGATTGDYADHTSTVAEPTCSNPDVCGVCGMEIGYVPHSWDEGVVTQQPDCSTETNGTKLLTCTVCGATQEEDIWVSHDWVVDEQISVTCTEDGYYKAHCSVCNKIDEYTTEAQGHYNWYAACGETTTCMECGTEFTKNHEGSPATCTEPMYCYNCWQYVGEPAGHQYTYPCDKFCSVCYEETNPNATHTIVHVEAKAATCYEDGNIEHWYCSDCGIAWADEALTQQTNLKSVILPMAHGEATHVEAKDATCTETGNIEYWLCEACGQAWLDEACTLNTNVLAVVLPTIDHDYVYGICSVCQAKDPAYVDYYLVGYINGADYGCEADYANLGEYKFVDGKLTVTFNADSYVFVKTGNLNGESVKWYLFETYHDASMTEGTLIENKSEKMFIPGGVEVVFTLVVNEDGTLTLSYHLHSYEAVVTEPTCTNAGYTTHTCSCGASYTDSEVEALGHADENGDYKCDACSTKVLPEDGATLTVAQALAIAKMQSHNTYTTQKYYITGIVTNVYNTTYGNFYLKDADGNEICIYGLYMDGTRYDAMNYKPVEGDEVTVYGPLGAYNTTYQMKNAELDDVVAHEHDYVAVVTAPTCVAAGFTTHTCSICKASYTDSEVAALGHTTEEGVCDNCGLTIGGDAPVIGELARFDFGSNGSAAHVDGNDLGTSKSYTAGSQTLSLTSMSKVYGPAYDAKGNSCIKLGTSSKTGTLTFTVGENVTEVVIYVAGYKAATSTNIKVNGVQYNVTTASNNGAYTAITIDTTTTKTITLTTVTYRCMIDAIVFNGVVG